MNSVQISSWTPPRRFFVSFFIRCGEVSWPIKTEYLQFRKCDVKRRFGLIGRTTENKDKDEVEEDEQSIASRQLAVEQSKEQGLALLSDSHKNDETKAVYPSQHSVNLVYQVEKFQSDFHMSPSGSASKRLFAENGTTNGSSEGQLKRKRSEVSSSKSQISDKFDFLTKRISKRLCPNRLHSCLISDFESP